MRFAFAASTERFSCHFLSAFLNAESRVIPARDSYRGLHARCVPSFSPRLNRQMHLLSEFHRLKRQRLPIRDAIDDPSAS